MNILAIDTSTSVLSVAVSEENKLLGEITTIVKKNHSVRLLPTIDQLLKDVNLLPTQINGIAVAKGPGSYTGVRIGVTTAKMLAWTLNIPLVGISSLAVLAANMIRTDYKISPIFDARRGRVYTGLYEIKDCGIPTPVINDCIISLEKWLEQLIGTKEQVMFIGDDLSIYGDTIESQWGIKNWPTNPPLHVARASMLAFLGIEQLKKGIKEDTHLFSPDYLQLSEAESNWISLQSTGEIHG